MELSQAKLEEMVVGKPIDPTVRFYESAVLDVAASKASGRRIYNNILMIERRVPGVTDYVPQRAKARDITRWPGEYAAYKKSVQMKKSPEVGVIPGISNVEAQELIDRGLGTVERLATATDVPAHLGHLVPMARRIHEAIQAEEINSEQEESSKEGPGEEKGNSLKAFRERGEPDVPAPGRQEHRGDVGRPEPAPAQGNAREAGQRLHPSGQLNGRQDWSLIKFA